MKIGLQISRSPGPAATPRSVHRSPGSSGPPTTSASIRSGSWTTSSRSAASDRPRNRCSRAGRPSASWPRTRRGRGSGCMVGGIHYRQAGLWVKAATTLDVLSGGRAWLGIGAAWNERRSPTAWASRSRRSASGFEMLEETLRYGPRDVAGRARQRGARSRVVTTRRPGCSTAPQALTRPAPADHDRRRRRAEDAPPRRPVRRRDERLRRRPPGSPTSTRSCASTASGSAGRTTRSSGRPSSRVRTQSSTAAGGTRDAGPGRRPLRRAGRRRCPARHLQCPRRG